MEGLAISKNGFVLCVYPGNCPSFQKMDIFRVLSDIRGEKLMDYVCLYPQFCVGDGEAFLKVLLTKKKYGPALVIPRLLVVDDRAKRAHEVAIGSVDKEPVETLMAGGFSEEEAVDVVARGRQPF